MLFPRITYAYLGQRLELYYGLNVDRKDEKNFNFRTAKQLLTFDSDELIVRRVKVDGDYERMFAHMNIHQLLSILDQTNEKSADLFAKRLLPLIDNNSLLLAKHGWDDITLVKILMDNPRLKEYFDTPLLFFLLIKAILDGKEPVFFDRVKRHELINTLFETSFTKADIVFMRNVDISELGINVIFNLCDRIVLYPSIFALYRIQQATNCIDNLLLHFDVAHDYANALDDCAAEIIDANFTIELFRQSEGEVKRFLDHYQDAFIVLSEANNIAFNNEHFVAKLRNKKSFKSVLKTVNRLIGNQQQKVKQQYSKSQLLSAFPKPVLEADNMRIFHLKTVSDLFEESETNRHCVYSYVSRVQSQELDIYKYEYEHERGTLAILREDDEGNPHLDQFFGYRNASMSKPALEYVISWYEAGLKKISQRTINGAS